MDNTVVRVAVLFLGALLSWLLHLAGNEAGWFGGGVILALGAMVVGLTSTIYVIVVSVMRLKKKLDDVRTAYAFILVSLIALTFGASQMIAW